MDELSQASRVATADRQQTRRDPLATNCQCGWRGSRLRLIPVQDSDRRLCPECLMTVTSDQAD
jgi:hypothetical protein